MCGVGQWGSGGLHGGSGAFCRFIIAAELRFERLQVHSVGLGSCVLYRKNVVNAYNATLVHEKFVSRPNSKVAGGVGIACHDVDLDAICGGFCWNWLSPKVNPRNTYNIVISEVGKFMGRLCYKVGDLVDGGDLHTQWALVCLLGA